MFLSEFQITNDTQSFFDTIDFKQKFLGINIFQFQFIILHLIMKKEKNVYITQSQNLTSINNWSVERPI